MLELTDPTRSTCLERWEEELPKEKLAIPGEKKGSGQNKRLGVHCRKNMEAAVSCFLNGETEQVEGHSVLYTITGAQAETHGEKSGPGFNQKL